MHQPFSALGRGAHLGGGRTEIIELAHQRARRLRKVRGQHTRVKSYRVEIVGMQEAGQQNIAVFGIAIRAQRGELFKSIWVICVEAGKEIRCDRRSVNHHGFWTAKLVVEQSREQKWGYDVDLPGALVSVDGAHGSIKKPAGIIGQAANRSELRKLLGERADLV